MTIYDHSQSTGYGYLLADNMVGLTELIYFFKDDYEGIQIICGNPIRNY